MTDPVAAVRGLHPLALLAATRLGACMCVAVSLGIPDTLRAGTRTVDELAAAAGAQVGQLARLLRALAGAGYLSAEDGRYGLTPLGENLCDTEDTAVQHWIRMFQDVSFFRSHAELMHTVTTGGSGYAQVNGAEMLLHFGEKPDIGAVFDRAMTYETATIAPDVIAAADFSRFATVADIGGSHGALLAAVLQAHPDLEGILFDRSRVVPAAR